MQFITLYGYEDIVTARIEGSSGSLWSISPPSREQMRRELQNGSSDITIRLTWTFQRYHQPDVGGKPCLYPPPLLSLCCLQGPGQGGDGGAHLRQTQHRPGAWRAPAHGAGPAAAGHPQHPRVSVPGEGSGGWTPPMLGESVPPLLTPFFCRQVPKLFPKYIRAPNGPEAPPVKQLLPGGSHHVLPHKIKGC